MPVLGITGGIATGKSSFVRALRAEHPWALFDADATAHELLAGDEAVRGAVVEAFGVDILDSSGRPDRARLRACVFADPAARRRLEGILHPVIRQRWLAEAAEYRARPEWLLVDIPLLYETEAQAEFARVVVVACSPTTQRQRLAEQRMLDFALAEAMVGAQLDLALKISQADHVIWNDSTLACLEAQASLFAALLRNSYG